MSNCPQDGRAHYVYDLEKIAVLEKLIVELTEECNEKQETIRRLQDKVAEIRDRTE